MTDHREPPPRVVVWGVPLTPVTMAEALDFIDQWIAERGEPRYLVSANVQYAMLCAENPRLDEVNREASLVLVDGMPLVWAARGKLPERVAGSDLVPALCARAAQRGHRLFLLGAAPGIAEQAAANLRARHPDIAIVGCLAPPYRDLDPGELAELFAIIRAARPDILIGAFSQPRGEFWMHAHHRAIGVPVNFQVGATLDFLAGRVARAPRWMRRTGLEWLFRMLREPRRLVGRYARNGWFVVRMLLTGGRSRR